MAVAVSGGSVYLAGMTAGALGTSAGGVWRVRRAWTRQFGTVDDDAADPFAEANVYVTTVQAGTQVSGLTTTDVFRTAFSAEGENTVP